MEERAKGGGVKNKRGRVGMFGLKVDERNWKFVEINRRLL